MFPRLRLSLNQYAAKRDNTMIVCICRGASDREIRAAIEGGAKCVDKLEQHGIGGDCRGCEDALREMISDCAGGDSDACRSCCNFRGALATA
jgi:bacterioferritin-associated ferredoxin